MSVQSYREVVFKTGSDQYTVCVPRTVRVGKYAAYLLHGASTPTEYTGAAGWPSALQLKGALARAGIPVITHTLGGDSMANDAAMTAVGTLPGLLATVVPGIDQSKMHLIGTSMGGGVAARYAVLNPSKVASVTGMIPMANPNAIHQQNPGTALSGGFTNLLATAWGTSFTILTVTLTNGSNAMVATVGSFTSGMVGYYVVKNTTARTGSMDTTIPFGTTVATFTDATHATLSANFTGTTGSYQVAVAQPLPAGANITSQAGAIASAGVSGRLFHSTVDPYIDPADVQALASAAGWSAVAVDSTAGHTNGTVAQVGSYNGGSGFSDLLAWLTARGA